VDLLPTRIETVDPITDPRWRRFVERHPAATIFHHPSWMRLLQQQYRYTFTAPCVVGPEGAVLAGLPIARIASRLTGTRLVSLPFSDACAVLDGGAAALRAKLLEAITATVETAQLGLEIREAVPDLRSGRPVRRFWAHHVMLPADGRCFRPAVRRGIAKARRAGLVTEWRTDEAALSSFYELHLQTRRRHGTPTQSKRFIMRFTDLFRDGLGAVVLVRRDSDTLAAAVFLWSSAAMTYKYGASDARHLDVRPNNLLFMDAIRRGSEQGLRVLDLGRTDMGNEGLRSFKRGWGAQEADLFYTYLGATPPADGARRAEHALATVIRHGPPVLGRIIGTALYRHMG
jgi:CelD/BcsL family acetyltransferase involved in cellulose biosynthesis